MRDYAIDLTEYYEPKISKPLLAGHIVSHNNVTYRVDRWFKAPKDIECHCYVFVDITIDTTLHIKPFAKKPSDVEALLKNNILQIRSYNP